MNSETNPPPQNDPTHKLIDPTNEFLGYKPNSDLEHAANTYLEKTTHFPAYHNLISEGNIFHSGVPIVGGETSQAKLYKFSPQHKVPYVSLAAYDNPLFVEPHVHIDVSKYIAPESSLMSEMLKAFKDAQLHNEESPNKLVLPSPINFDSVQGHSALPKSIDDPDDNFSFGPVEVVTKGPVPFETQTTKEKKTKAQKLGTLVTKASVQVGKVFTKVMSNMGAISVLAPGSAILYAEQVNDVTQPIAESRVIPEELREIPGLFESQGYIKEAPNFRDQVADSSRTNTFKHSIQDFSYKSRPKVEITEHEGLVGLQQFLENYATFAAGNEALVSRRETARSMLESLTFIGENEYLEAAKGLGEYWKAYLDADPKRQICIMTTISKSRDQRKSDTYLFEKILDTFTDEDIERYSGRIVNNPEDIKVRPDSVKVVLLDDWTISGQQMRSAYSSIEVATASKRFASSVEVNLITTSARRVQEGLRVMPWDGHDKFLPVKAYYLAHNAVAKTTHEQNAHITGTHSSVDYDYESVIAQMTLDLNKGNTPETPDNERVAMPPLTNIVRVYYTSTPAVEVQRDRIVRKKRVDA